MRDGFIEWQLFLAELAHRHRSQEAIEAFCLDLVRLLAPLCAAQGLAFGLLALGNVQISQNWYDPYLAVLGDLGPGSSSMKSAIFVADLHLISSRVKQRLVELDVALPNAFLPRTAVVLELAVLLPGLRPDPVLVL